MVDSQSVAVGGEVAAGVTDIVVVQEAGAKLERDRHPVRGAEQIEPEPQK
jgi:hypothetical protein